MKEVMRIVGLTLMVLVCGVCHAQAEEVVFEGKWSVVYHPYQKEAIGMKWALHATATALAESLNESVGVEARAVFDTAAPKGPGRRIFIGEAFAQKAGLMPNDFGTFDWGIAEKDGDLYCFGRDFVARNGKDTSGCVIQSAFAAIQFMREEMGVLFVMPGKVGREVPRREKLAVKKGYFRRGTIKVPYQYGCLADYVYKQANAIYSFATLHSYGGHTYNVACPRAKYRQSHPEYFAKNAKGEPIWAGSEGCQPYCISNPEFRKLLYDEMLKRFDSGAEITQLGQNDGSAAVCKCKACYDLYGTGNDWTEKLWLFHKGLAEDILRDRPGKIVHILSYAETAKPPKTFKKFPSNVMIESCGYSEEHLARWKNHIVPHGFTFYIYNWGWYPILGFTPKRSIAGLVDQVKRFHRYNMRGIYRCGYGELFGMEGPAYWVFNKLVEDPNVNVPAALATYYRGAFGPAADAMRRFYEDLESPLAEVERLNSTKASDLVESTLKRPKERDPIRSLSVVYTPARVARMDAALAAAERTPGLSDRQKRRLQLVRTEWNYVRNIGTIAYQYNQFRAHPTKAGRDGILALMEERNAMIADLFPDGKMRVEKDWPELRLFGRPSLEHFKQNGRLSAPIKVPLTWDIAKMRKYRIVPNEMMTPEERQAELTASGAKPILTFEPIKMDLVKGATFTPYPDRTGFHFTQGSNGHVRVSARLGSKEGLMPGKTYRISWLCRWDDVDSARAWNGFYFSADYDRRRGNDKCMIQEPSDVYHFGSSDGWRRESIVMTMSDDPTFSSTFTFRFWGCKNGKAEVRDVAVEEVTP